MNPKFEAVLIATAATTSLALCGAASAGPSGEPKGASPEEVVRYSDLDLATTAGFRTLYSRLSSAAWRVCLKITPVGIENVKCRQTLLDASVQDVNRPELTALHRGGRESSLTAHR